MIQCECVCGLSSFNEWASTSSSSSSSASVAVIEGAWPQEACQCEVGGVGCKRRGPRGKWGNETIIRVVGRDVNRVKAISGLHRRCMVLQVGTVAEMMEEVARSWWQLCVCVCVCVKRFGILIWRFRFSAVAMLCAMCQL